MVTAFLGVFGPRTRTGVVVPAFAQDIRPRKVWQTACAGLLMLIVGGLARGGSDQAVTAVSAGSYGNCAHLADGSIHCWGSNAGNRFGIAGGGPLEVPMPHPHLASGTVRELKLGGSHACALMQDRTVRCWGAGGQGRLGNGGTANSLVPVAVSNLADVITIDTQNDTTCAVRADGAVFCWGANSSYGILGDGSVNVDALTPVQVANISTAVSVAVGDVHACAVLQDGSARCWGTNSNGQLGTGVSGAATSSPTPVAVIGLSNVVELVVSGSSDHSHSCARRNDGAVLCWGRNYSGQIGNGQAGATGDQWLHVATPTIVAGIGGAAHQVVVGGQFTCAVRADGRVLCWGTDMSGVIGFDSRDVSLRSTPVVRENPTAIVRLAAGTDHVCAMDDEARLQCWGDRSVGQLGDGTLGYVSRPIAVHELASVRSLSTGSRPFTCASTDAGQVHCWGLNENDILEAGSARAKTTPGAPMAGIFGADSVAVGGNHFCAVVTGGQVSCWGRNDRGQLGRVPGGTEPPAIIGGFDQVKRLALGWQHSCALHQNGRVSCWGLNSSGQLGRGTTINSHEPGYVLGVEGAVGLDVGEQHACAVVGNGDVYCWGSNSSRQFSDVAPAVVATPIRVFQGADDVGTGRFHSCALTSAGRVSCWGGSSATVRGQLDGLINVTALSSAYNHNCVIVAGGTVRCWGENHNGRLGNGSTQNSALPVPVAGLMNVASLSLGHGDSCALLVDGTTACWGDNVWGRLGNGHKHYSPQAVTVVFDPAAGDTLFRNGFERPVLL